jgi:hypothetical protein
MMRIRQLLPQSMHDIGVLPHRQIQQNPLGRKQALRSLPRPAGKNRNETPFSRISSGFGLYRHNRASVLLHCSIDLNI